MKTPREIIATSGCVLGHGLKDRGRRQSADSIIFDLEEAGYVIVPLVELPPYAAVRRIFRVIS